MAEEVQSGTAPVAIPAEQAAPATPQAPLEQTPQVPLSHGGGKTVEQLSAEVEEQATLVREANERAARMEHEVLLTRNIMENLTRDRGGKQEEVSEVPSVTDDEFLTNPAKATGKIIESYFARERQERERERVGQYVEKAKAAYETGKQEAMKANPTLYRGIEADISREVLNNVQSSLKAGQPVDEAVLRNPRYWEAAALAMRVMNGEDVSRYYTKPAHTPMSPAYTETPSAGAPPKAEMTLSPEQEELISRAGITREQFLANWAKVKTETTERNR